MISVASILPSLYHNHASAFQICEIQALIYFAVSKKGEAPGDGVTDLNPEGLTSACGIWANDFKGRLSRGGLTCHVLSEDRQVVVSVWRRR